ncbi:DUF6705 family protein [Elizabethkingia ursingii]
MKNFVITLILTLFSISCQSQTRGLKEAAISTNNSLGSQTIENVAYLKDIDNSLNKFEGTWKGESDGKIYEFRFIKKSKYGENPARDIIIGRLIVKDSSGNIIYSTINKPDDETGLLGLNFQKNQKTYLIYYTGKNNICGDQGTLNIYFKDPNNLREMNLFLLGSGDIAVQSRCANYTPLITPEKTLKLSRQ